VNFANACLASKFEAHVNASRVYLFGFIYSETCTKSVWKVLHILVIAKLAQVQKTPAWHFASFASMACIIPLVSIIVSRLQFLLHCTLLLIIF